jgi:hypothetical protein
VPLVALVAVIKWLFLSVSGEHAGLAFLPKAAKAAALKEDAAAGEERSATAPTTQEKEKKGKEKETEEEMEDVEGEKTVGGDGEGDKEIEAAWAVLAPAVLWHAETGIQQHHYSGGDIDHFASLFHLVDDTARARLCVGSACAAGRVDVVQLVLRCMIVMRSLCFDQAEEEFGMVPSSTHARTHARTHAQRTVVNVCVFSAICRRVWKGDFGLPEARAGTDQQSRPYSRCSHLSFRVCPIQLLLFALIIQFVVYCLLVMIIHIHLLYSWPALPWPGKVVHPGFSRLRR